MSSILITGGCGMIGSNLAKRLVREGWDVFVADSLWRGKLENLNGADGKPVIDLATHFFMRDLTVLSDAEDVIGDAVADAYAGFSRLRNLDSFRPWIFKILSNKCRRKLKEYMNKTVELPDDLACSRDGLEEDCQVRQAFSKLEEEERLIISMHIFAGYTSKEIGRILHKKKNKEDNAWNSNDILRLKFIEL